MKLSFNALPTTRERKSPRHNRAFSLMEMLVVVTIVSILMALTMSSFSTLKTASLTSSGNEIVDVFSMARQNSLTKNAYTVVAIKTQGAGAGSAYCLLELVRRDDGSFGSWTAITPWHFLGKGSVFEVHSHTGGSGSGTDTFMPGAVLPQPLPSAYPFQGQLIDLTASTIAQCYQPDGTLSTQPALNTRLVLRLTQGLVDSSTGAVTYQGATLAGHQVSYYDLVFVSNTGVAKIERL